MQKKLKPKVNSETLELRKKKMNTKTRVGLLSSVMTTGNAFQDLCSTKRTTKFR